MNLKKNYNEIINENNNYTFNKDLLQIINSIMPSTHDLQTTLVPINIKMR